MFLQEPWQRNGRGLQIRLRDSTGARKPTDEDRPGRAYVLILSCPEAGCKRFHELGAGSGQVVQLADAEAKEPAKPRSLQGRVLCWWRFISVAGGGSDRHGLPLYSMPAAMAG